jgi:AraC-like DNA-binding protein
MTARPHEPVVTMPVIAAYTQRETSRAALRRAFPRRRGKLLLTRTASELERAFRRELVDAVVVDIASASDDTWRAAALARDFPSAAFYGLSSYRTSDAAGIARCVEQEFADVVAEGVDDTLLRELILRDSFTVRFARALDMPPAALGLTERLQRDTWNAIVAHAGRTVRTEVLAKSMGLTREHLSRRFASQGSPNLKRVSDLVRLIAAAELAKNPGYDIADVAAVLRFASASHLATTTHRVLGIRPASLSRLRAVDLIKRFADGRGRSRS